MEAGWHPEGQKKLQKLRERLCRETDPLKLYKTLKKLSSLPVLSDLLAEIGFRQTIKGLREQQLLVPFAKDLAARWSEGTLLGPQPEDDDPGPKDWALVKNLNSESPRTSAKEKAHAPAPAPAPRPGKAPESEREVLEVSRASPGPSRKKSRHTSREGMPTGSGSCEPRAERIRRCRKMPLHWSQEDALTGTFESCLNIESTPSPPVSPPSPLQPLPSSKRKRKSAWKDEAQSPGAKALLGRSASCHARSPRALSATPASHPSRQACTPLHGLEPPSWKPDQEAELWASWVSLQGAVYSGPRPAGGLAQTSHQGLLLAEDCSGSWAAHCQAAPVKAQEGESGQPEEESWIPETQRCKQTHSQTETQTHLQLKESQEPQALRGCIQSTQAKARQARLPTKMAAFHTQVKSPGPQEGSGGLVGAPFSENHMLPEASGHSLTRGSPWLPSGVGGSDKRQAKKRPAPLMAKALRDYKKSFLGRRI